MFHELKTYNAKTAQYSIKALKIINSLRLKYFTYFCLFTRGPCSCKYCTCNHSLSGLSIGIIKPGRLHVILCIVNAEGHGMALFIGLDQLYDNSRPIGLVAAGRL